MTKAQPRISAGHMIVRQLEHEGVERAYTVPGESFLDVLDGLHDSSIETIVARHEGGAGFMALAEGRLTGIPGVAMVTRGPGAANAFIAVHTAWQDASPLLLLVGLVPIPDRGREAFQEFDLRGWFGPTAKWVTKLDDPAAAARVISEGMRIAASGRPGPVVIGLPEDLIREASGPDVVPPTPRRRASGSQREMDELHERLAHAERPLVIVGGDGWQGDAGTRVAAWAGAHGIPIAAHWRSHDAVPHDHEAGAFVGILGHNHADYIAELFDDSDLHVFVGIPRGDVVSGGFSVGLDVPAIVVTPGEPLGHAGRLDRHIPADIAAWAGALPAPSDPVPQARTQRLSNARATFERYREIEPLHPATGVDVSVAMGVIRERLDDDAIITFGAGNYMQWPIRYLSHNAPGTLVAPRNGAMGMGVPASVAASLV
ncbi:MAG TPA: acetolactate synthase, partial [Candidatus Agrococcus pullicola]|nr:acetolactate synthase [Candidatus Agrococcus pullicola]